jgi:putative transposase
MLKPRLKKTCQSGSALFRPGGRFFFWFSFERPHAEQKTGHIPAPHQQVLNDNGSEIGASSDNQVLSRYASSPLHNGPELISQRLASWAEKSDVLHDFIEPGKPAQNAYIERFNRTYREDVLDFYIFSSLAEAREITEQWLEEYNAIRPHDSLGGNTRYQYVSVNVQESESVQL